MKAASMIPSGILLVSFAVTGLGQLPTTTEHDKNKSEGTVDADRDRAGKTGHIGDGDRGGVGNRPYGGSDLVALENQLDLDKDGRVSKKEYDQAFNRMDTNGDGYLSSQEFRQAGSRSAKPDGPSANKGQSPSLDRNLRITEPRTLP